MALLWMIAFLGATGNAKAADFGERRGVSPPWNFIVAPRRADAAPLAGDLHRYEFDEPHMGTSIRIILYAVDKPTAVNAVRLAFKRFAAIEQVLSDYRPGSEIMKLCTANDAEPGKQFPISDDLAAVMAVALDTSKKCDGAFDMTIGPLSKLWRETRKTKTLPDAATLAAAKEKVGYAKVELDAAKKTLRLKVAGMRLDFGGIGKGYAADEALALLKKADIPSALVAASGDIAVGDPPPGREAWTVDIAPLGTGMKTRRVKLANAAVSTSGDLFQHIEIGGVRYSHVLDPATGLGLTGTRSATVIAKKGVTADSLTKAVSVLPWETALKLIESLEGTAASVVVKATTEAAVLQSASKRFADHEVKD